MKLKIKRLKGKYVKKKLESSGRKNKEKKVSEEFRNKSCWKHLYIGSFFCWQKANILRVLRLREEDILRAGLHLDQKLEPLRDASKLCCDMSKGKSSQTQRAAAFLSFPSLIPRNFVLCFGHPLILNSHKQSSWTTHPLLDSRTSESWPAATTTNCFSIKSPFSNW